MAGPIKVKRVEKGQYRIYRRDEHIADIIRTQRGDSRHVPVEPWLLESVSGRRDRFESKGEAVDEAHKI